MPNLHEIKIETEYAELIYKLARVSEKIETTSSIEVKRYISKLQPKTSSGFDTVSNFMIQIIPPIYIRIGGRVRGIGFFSSRSRPSLT